MTRTGKTSDTAARVLAWLTGQRAPLRELLRELVDAESPSDEPAAQAEVLEVLTRELRGLGFACRRVRGRHLYARQRTRGERPTQLLIGHCDTVWPIGTLAQRPFSEDGGLLRGPGVYDMKAGLTQIIFALRALRTLQLELQLAPVVLVNSDEEIGSRGSTDLIRKLAARADRAFVLEPSLGQEGRLKTARKGIGRFEVTARGEAAHAGLDPGKGVSAILELSHVVQALFALNDPARGVTVNVGQIDGGLRANVVAPESRAVVDVRVPTAEDAQRVEAAIRGLKPITPGARLEIEGGFGRPPMEPTPGNQALWRLALRLGHDLGLELEQATAGGGSDGNTTSLTTPTLDGLGAVGGGAHSRHEHVLEDSLAERTALLALLLLSPPQGRAT